MLNVFSISVDWRTPSLVFSTSWWAFGLLMLVGIGVWIWRRWGSRWDEYKLDSVTVDITLPGGRISGVLKPDESQRKAAWELYTELVTRISVVELQPEEGILREALSSLHSLFGTTRQILRQYGPSVSRPKKGDAVSVGYVAVSVLNLGLRPVLAKWHPKLQQHEAKRDPKVSVYDHEQAWDCRDELRKVLEELRSGLIEWAKILEKVAGVQTSLIVDRPSR